MQDRLDIRIWDSENKMMRYYSNARVVQGIGGERSYRYLNEENDAKYIKIGIAMQKTIYDIGNEPLYEKDVIIYRGEPCMVFIDLETHDAAIFYGEEKLFLKDIVDEAELFTNAYEKNEYTKIAVENFKKNLYKSYTKGIIHIIGFSNKEEQYAGFNLITEDGVKVNRRYKFMNQPFGYGEFYALMDALLEIRVKESRATMVKIKTNNEFMNFIMNNKGIISYWKRNGWVTNNGKKLENTLLLENIIYAADGLLIEAELMSQEEKQHMVEFLRK